jgi:hypothetical protein
MGSTDFLDDREGPPRLDGEISLQGEGVIRDGMDRYPCKERGVSEVGWTYILARREGSPSDLEA